MSRRNQRTNTIKTILAGSCIRLHASYSLIDGELSECDRTARVSPNNRQWLLQILHLTRALDSSLIAFMGQRAIPIDAKARHIKGYLRTLSNHSAPGVRRLPTQVVQNCQAAIVSPRNKYMHQAGAFPAAVKEVQSLRGEIETLLALVVAL